MRNREEIIQKHSGKLAHRRDGASAAWPPTEMCRDLDLAALRPWAAPCRGCLLLLPMRMKVLGPCLLKLKKQLSQRSSPRRPWRGRRRPRLWSGLEQLLEKNWSSGAANAAIPSPPMKLHLELRYDAECGPYLENESSERPREPTKVVNHLLVHNRPSTS